MKYRSILPFTAFVVAAILPLSATAGAKLKIDDNSDLDLGFRVQAMYLNNDAESDENTNEFRLRRARFRLKANITKWVTSFLQTEAANDGGSTGEDQRIIDAWAMLKPYELLNITGGLHMAATTRQNLTSSGGLLTMDRPGINNYILTWGQQGRAAFNTGTLAGTKSGLVGTANVRDLGASLFGKTSFNDTTHFKYYLGVFEGSTTRQGDPQRYAGRVQLNFFDPEPGYFQLASYLGEKKTIGLGAGFDQQKAVAVDSVTDQKVDYRLWSVDGFAEWPVGRGSLTAEAAYNNMALSGPGNPLASAPGGSILGDPAGQVEGDGFYVQSGYYINSRHPWLNKWQPWFGYEQWNANGTGDDGDWSAWRGGLSYFIKGHNAAIKFGYESVSNKTSGEPGANTFAAGIYTTF